MSVQHLLPRSSIDSTRSLHQNHDGSYNPCSALDREVPDLMLPGNTYSSSALFQYVLHCTLACGRLGLRIGAILLPSFVRDWNKVESRSLPLSAGNQALAALNGLRGAACLIVFNYHLVFVWTHSADVSWGTVIDTKGLEEKEVAKFKDNDQMSFVQLPFIRLLYAGHAMVIVFFVISGYVLSHKPMKLMRAGKFEELQRVLSSSVFRRGFRLFAPPLFATFITMLFTHAGYFDAGKLVRMDPVMYNGLNEEHPIQLSTLHEQIWDWLRTMGNLISNVWNWNLYFNNYDPHLWTIPLEYRSSIVLFITLLALSRLRPIARLILTSSIMASCLFYWARWEVFLFLAGMIFAELDLSSGIFDEPSLLDEKDSSGAHRSSGWIWACVMLMGLYCSSCPSIQPANAPGYSFLVNFVTEGYNWQPGRPLQALGGCLIVWSFMHLPSVQRIFATGAAQYLGQISYAFYIVHGPMLHAFGYRFVQTCWLLTGNETNAGFALGLGLAVLVLLPLAIWAADLFWRAIDAPYVELAKWIETKLSAESNNS